MLTFLRLATRLQPEKPLIYLLRCHNTKVLSLRAQLVLLGFFELPALGARALALLAGQAAAHRAREIEASRQKWPSPGGGVGASTRVEAEAELERDSL